MEWNRSEALALAKEKCAHCQGFGLRETTRKGPVQPCNCVLRSIFKACYSRFRYCVSKEKHMSRVSVENAGGRNRRPVWGRKDEEYIADFSLTAKNTLDEFEYKIFRFHYLLGADWKLCCRQMKLDRGTFFHMVYRIQQKLGRRLRELEPYALFPLDEYFGGAIRGLVSPEARKVLAMPLPKTRKKLYPPVKKAA